MSQFHGFRYPEQNWFRMPNEWTDITADIKSLSELKVVEYVLRHTWGYAEEYATPRRITMDEFVNGRKRADGTRLDRGTGLSNRAVFDGIAAAEKHGYLLVEVDETDTARIRKLYSLRMGEPDGGRQTLPPDNASLAEPPGKLCRSGRQSLPVEQGKTLPKKTTSRPANAGGLLDGKPPAEPDFAARMATIFFEALAKARMTQTKKSRPSLWARFFREFLAPGEISEAEFEGLLRWYIASIDNPNTPDCYSAKSFCENWGRILKARQRAERDKQPPAATARTPVPERRRLARRILHKCWDMHPEIGMFHPIRPEVIDEALAALGLPAGMFKYPELEEAGHED